MKYWSSLMMCLFGAASRLRVPPELLDFKFRVLKRKGYKVIDHR